MYSFSIQFLCVKNSLFFFEFPLLCSSKASDDDRSRVIVDINLLDYENG